MNPPYKCDLLIEHVSYLTEDFQIMDDQSIAIKDGRIHSVVPQDQSIDLFIPENRINGKGKLWMPGLVDGHIHTGQQLLKGRVLDELPMIWTRIMLPFESTLTPEKMRLSAGLAALEMIRNGTTGFVESGSYFMDDAAEVYAKSGLRGALSYSTMDCGAFPDSIRQTAREAVSSTDSLYSQYHGEQNLKVFYSLRALMNCSEELILLAASHAKERGTFLQAHMNEYAGEVNHCLEHHRLRPVEYLDSLGILGPNFLAAHGIMLSSHEIEILAANKAKIVHCPFSNCAKGVPNTPELLEHGICVGLGTDGAAHGGLSLWNEIKIFRSVMNAVWGTKNADPAVMPAKALLKMCTANGAAFLEGDGTLGRIAPGCHADLIAIDWSKTDFLASANRINTLVECVTGPDVTDCIVEGRLLMRDREILSVDEEKIRWEVEKYFSQETCL